MKISEKIIEFLKKNPPLEQKKICNDILKYIKCGELEDIVFNNSIIKVYLSTMAIHIMFKENENFEELQIVLPDLVKKYCMKNKENPLCKQVLAEIFKI